MIFKECEVSMKKTTMMIIVLLFLSFGFKSNSISGSSVIQLEGDNRIIQIELGIFAAYGLTATGDIYFWGTHEFSNQNFVSQTPTKLLETLNLGIRDDDPIQKIATGGYHFLAYSESGKLYTWGKGSSGELGYGTNSSQNYNPTTLSIFNEIDGNPYVLQENEKFIDISAGTTFSIAVTNLGNVFTWGNNQYGKLGHGNSISTNVPTRIDTFKNIDGTDYEFSSGEKVIKVKSGAFHNLALTNYNNVFIWGMNMYDQLGLDNGQTNVLYPTMLNSQFNITNGNALNNGETIIQIDAGGITSGIITSSNRVFVWGYNNSGQLGTTGTNTSQVVVPKEITNNFLVNGNTLDQNGDYIKSMRLGNNSSIFLSSKGQVFTVGIADGGQLGNKTTTNSLGTIYNITDNFMLTPNNASTKLSNIGDQIEHITISSDANTGALTKTGRFFIWGRDTKYIRGVNTTNSINSTPVYNTYLIPKANTLQYNYEDGVTQPESIVYPYKTEITLPTPTRNYFTFGGWYKEDTFINQYIVNEMPSEDVALYAKWIPIDFNINYNLDGGVNHSDNPLSYNYNQSIELSTPTKTGHSFLGWFTDAQLTSSIENIQINSNGHVDLYAKWTINTYTITFDTDGGSSISAITQDYATAVTAPEDPEKEGYTFGGWDADIPTTMPASDQTLTATWTINAYTITFDTDGGTQPNDQIHTYNIESDTINLLSPSKEGYTFIGWYESNQFQIRIDSIDPNERLENLTVYAFFLETEVTTLMMLIDTLGDISLNKKNDIEDLFRLYESLNEDQKAYINYEILEDYQSQIEILEVNLVLEQIALLPTEIDLTDEAALEAIQALYDQLTPEQQAQVTSYETYTAQVEVFEVKEVEALIASLSETVDLTDEATLEAIQALYDQLTPEQQAQVTSYETYTAQVEVFEVIKELDVILNKENPTEEELKILLEKVDLLPQELKDQLDIETLETLSKIENDLNRLSTVEIIAIALAITSIAISTVVFIQFNKMKGMKKQ